MKVVQIPEPGPGHGVKGGDEKAEGERSELRCPEEVFPRTTCLHRDYG